VLDRRAFRPVATGLAIIEAFRATDSVQFAWRDPPYEYEHDKPPIDILYGSAALRERLDAGTPADDLVREWDDELAPFLEVRQRFLLY
jgi:uncharacterized protein YbbC (DUF1343 family)